MGKCKCGNRTRIVSDVVQSMQHGRCKNDVCTTPICGEPNQLSIYAPLIYDEIGVNLCATFPTGVDLPTAYPSVTNARVQVVNATYTVGTGPGTVQVEAISGRPNCSAVTLSGITVMFALHLYDDNCRYVDTIFTTAEYLPGATTAATYDEDTNPTSVELEIFTPYGFSYAPATAPATPTQALNFVGFTSGANAPLQGLNLSAMAKVLDLDLESSEVTIGLTLVLLSLYYAGYKVKSQGKIDVPKGSIVNPENSDCMRFVAGDLLNLEIKPLDLGAPNYEECCKIDYTDAQTCGSCEHCKGRPTVCTETPDCKKDDTNPCENEPSCGTWMDDLG